MNPFLAWLGWIVAIVAVAVAIGRQPETPLVDALVEATSELGDVLLTTVEVPLPEADIERTEYVMALEDKVAAQQAEIKRTRDLTIEYRDGLEQAVAKLNEQAAALGLQDVEIAYAQRETEKARSAGKAPKRSRRPPKVVAHTPYATGGSTYSGHGDVENKDKDRDAIGYVEVWLHDGYGEVGSQSIAMSVPPQSRRTYTFTDLGPTEEARGNRFTVYARWIAAD